VRERAAATLVDLFREDERLAIVLADISTDLFAPALRHDPRRAVNVGIMEQAAVGVAAGFALEGFHPVVHTIAPFLAERPLEQVKLDFGYQRLGGLFLSVGASYDYGASGMTHHSPGDVAALSTVPGIEVLLPGTADETERLVRATYANGRPTYMRLQVTPNAHSRELAPGGLTVVRRGSA
jgi:transketolase